MTDMVGQGAAPPPPALPSYARARSSSSSTIPRRKGSPATRRWTRAETKAHIAAGPLFRFPPPEEELLDELCAGYTTITKDPVRSPAKRDLVATGYRVHGSDYLAVVEQRFRELGTVTNLLGEVRATPAVDDPDSVALDDQDAEVPEPVAAAMPAELPALVYSPTERPPFDPTSNRRYDRHPSNPAAGGFFSNDELGGAGDRPGVKALTR
jgi:hypothetical protein